jgi:hypothetical protein
VPITNVRFTFHVGDAKHLGALHQLDYQQTQALHVRRPGTGVTSRLSRFDRTASRRIWHGTIAFSLDKTRTRTIASAT